MKSLYHQILAAGIPHGNHESDLHIQATPAAWAILKQFPLESGNSRTFTNQGRHMSVRPGLTCPSPTCPGEKPSKACTAPCNARKFEP